MIDPLLGELTSDEYEGLVSAPIAVAFLGGHRCRFAIEGGADELARDDVRAAIRNTLAATPALLAAAEPHVIAYCDDLLRFYPEDERPRVTHDRPGDIWTHVRLGDQLHVTRRAEGDDQDGVYLSLECSCDWEQEHGLQLVVRDGTTISRVGPFDGHVTHSDASLARVVYRRIR